MKNSNNVSKISDYTLELETDIAWADVIEKLSTLKAFDRIMPKAIPRSGKAMERAIMELVEAVRFYGELRAKQ
jgi:hypothetical protein